MATILIRNHEIGLKGGNKQFFERLLTETIVTMLKREGKQARTYFNQTRMFLETDLDDVTHSVLRRCFGIYSYSEVIAIPTDVSEMGPRVSDLLVSNPKFALAIKSNSDVPFAVRSRRSEKAVPETSVEIDRMVGSFLRTKFPFLKTNLSNPELTVGIEIRSGQSYVWVSEFPGPGGMPAGTQGRVLSLQSGGIDSPVAAIQMIKRGASVDSIHFYGEPFVGESILHKLKESVKEINRYQVKYRRCQLVSFGKIQEVIALATPPKIRTVLYRRMMMRIASRVAKISHCYALVTGEALGQVASQTLRNLSVIDEAASVPVLRPLIGYDKIEIVNLAKVYETFQTSIRESEDSCVLFASKSPETGASLEQVYEEESKFDVEALVDMGVSSLRILREGT